MGVDDEIAAIVARLRRLDAMAGQLRQGLVDRRVIDVVQSWVGADDSTRHRACGRSGQRRRSGDSGAQTGEAAQRQAALDRSRAGGDHGVGEL